jgi:hypothetical protein
VRQPGVDCRSGQEEKAPPFLGRYIGEKNPPVSRSPEGGFRVRRPKRLWAKGFAAREN